MDRMLAIPEDRNGLSTFRLCLLMALTILMLMMALPGGRAEMTPGHARNAENGHWPNT